jgi:hypothetical protein
MISAPSNPKTNTYKPIQDIPKTSFKTKQYLKVPLE